MLKPIFKILFSDYTISNLVISIAFLSLSPISHASFVVNRILSQAPRLPPLEDRSWIICSLGDLECDGDQC